SIHLTDVVEIYEVTADHRMKQSEIIFEQFGIGMPSNAEEGETFVYEDGKYHIQHMNHRFTSLNIRSRKNVSNHRLIGGVEGEEETLCNEESKYHIQHMNHQCTPLNNRNGKVVSNHRLIWGEEGEKMVRFN